MYFYFKIKLSIPVFILGLVFLSCNAGNAVVIGAPGGNSDFNIKPGSIPYDRVPVIQGVEITVPDIGDIIQDLSCSVNNLYNKINKSFRILKDVTFYQDNFAKLNYSEIQNLIDYNSDYIESLNIDELESDYAELQIEYEEIQESVDVDELTVQEKSILDDIESKFTYIKDNFSDVAKVKDEFVELQVELSLMMEEEVAVAEGMEIKNSIPETLGSKLKEFDSEIDKLWEAFGALSKEDTEQVKEVVENAEVLSVRVRHTLENLELFFGELNEDTIYQVSSQLQTIKDDLQELKGGCDKLLDSQEEKIVSDTQVTEDISLGEKIGSCKKGISELVDKLEKVSEKSDGTNAQLAEDSNRFIVKLEKVREYLSKIDLEDLAEEEKAELNEKISELEEKLNQYNEPELEILAEDIGPIINSLGEFCKTIVAEEFRDFGPVMEIAETVYIDKAVSQDGVVQTSLSPDLEVERTSLGGNLGKGMSVAYIENGLESQVYNREFLEIEVVGTSNEFTELGEVTVEQADQGSLNDEMSGREMVMENTGDSIIQISGIDIGMNLDDNLGGDYSTDVTAAEELMTVEMEDEVTDIDLHQNDRLFSQSTLDIIEVGTSEKVDLCSYKGNDESDDFDVTSIFSPTLRDRLRNIRISNGRDGREKQTEGKKVEVGYIPAPGGSEGDKDVTFKEGVEQEAEQFLEKNSGEKNSGTNVLDRIFAWGLSNLRVSSDAGLTEMESIESGLLCKELDRGYITSSTYTNAEIVGNVSSVFKIAEKSLGSLLGSLFVISYGKEYTNVEASYNNKAEQIVVKIIQAFNNPEITADLNSALGDDENPAYLTCLIEKVSKISDIDSEFLKTLAYAKRSEVVGILNLAGKGIQGRGLLFQIVAFLNESEDKNGKRIDRMPILKELIDKKNRVLEEETIQEAKTLNLSSL